MEFRIEHERKYTSTHEWLQLYNGVATIGVTDYAQLQLSDVVYVELPSVGDTVQAGGALATLESVKAVGEVYAPVSGEITEVNDELTDHPEWVNEDPFGKGWLVKMRPQNFGDADALMDAAAYAVHLEAQK